MSNQPSRHLTTPEVSIDEYLALEEQSEGKHEYVDGQIIAMAGSTGDHALITINISSALRQLLKGKPCRVYSSDLKIRPASRRRFRYPEASVICGPVEYDPASKSKHVALNPRVLVEVLSPSTERTDRTEKLLDYILIPSLQEYILVSQHEPRVETILRQADGTWAVDHALGTDKTIRLLSLDIELPLSEVFDGVEFPEAAPEESPEKEGNEK
jgi:Uma2 family endonuclease